MAWYYIGIGPIIQNSTYDENPVKATEGSWFTLDGNEFGTFDCTNLQGTRCKNGVFTLNAEYSYSNWLQAGQNWGQPDDLTNKNHAVVQRGGGWEDALKTEVGANNAICYKRLILATHNA